EEGELQHGRVRTAHPRSTARRVRHGADDFTLRDMGRGLCRHQIEHDRSASAWLRRHSVLPGKSGPPRLGALSAYSAPDRAGRTACVNDYNSVLLLYKSGCLHRHYAHHFRARNCFLLHAADFSRVTGSVFFAGRSIDVAEGLWSRFGVMRRHRLVFGKVEWRGRLNCCRGRARLERRFDKRFLWHYGEKNCGENPSCYTDLLAVVGVLAIFGYFVMVVRGGSLIYICRS